MLKHKKALEIYNENVFDHVNSYDDLIEKIVEYGKENVSEYNDRVGMAFEVYTEYFFNRYVSDNNPFLNIKEIFDTSSNPYTKGYDFTYHTSDNQIGAIQSKFRKSDDAKLSYDEINSFRVQCEDELEIKDPNRAILFTNLYHDGSELHDVFHYTISEKTKNKMRVFSRKEQTDFIDRDPNFWNDFRKELQLTYDDKLTVVDIPELWDHQKRMLSGIDRVINSKDNRGRIICATGGGKTVVFVNSIIKRFEENFKIQIIVAPTIDLVIQHHTVCENYGMFTKTNINPIHIRTGEDARDRHEYEYTQTTDVEGLKFDKEKNLIFVTYASVKKLLKHFSVNNIFADVIYWDEYHRLVSQTEKMFDFIDTLPAKNNIFLSASIKDGRIVSGNDEDLFGKIYAEVSYKELRSKCIVVPKIRIKLMEFSEHARLEKPKSVIETLRKNNPGKDDGFEYRKLVVECVGTTVSYLDQKRIKKNVNMLTFSNRVSFCKIMNDLEPLKELTGAEIRTIHSGVRGSERKRILSEVKKSNNSLLLQHSVLREGIDVNNFSSAFFAREMLPITVQQAIGRIARSNPEDRKNFENGSLSLDNPNNWEKYYADVYILTDGHDTKETFFEFVKDLIYKLEEIGLKEGDYEFAEIPELCKGKGEDSNSWMSDLIKDVSMISEEEIIAQVEKVKLEIDEEIWGLQFNKYKKEFEFFID